LIPEGIFFQLVSMPIPCIVLDGHPPLRESDIDSAIIFWIIQFAIDHIAELALKWRGVCIIDHPKTCGAPGSLADVRVSGLPLMAM